MIAAMPKSQAASGPPGTAPIPTEAGSVAIVHDYLNQPGGAERVVLELARIWPQAPIYTSIYRAESTFPEFRHREIRTSALNRIPVDRAFRALLPLYPAAFRSLGTLDQDLVISSSSGWAHGVRTAPGSTHVVYCHTPARWLYKGAEYTPSRAARVALTPVTKALERWDRRAARRANLYLANSENTRARIRAAYGIEARGRQPAGRHGALRSRGRAASGCWSSRACCPTSASTWWSRRRRAPASRSTWSEPVRRWTICGPPRGRASLSTAPRPTRRWWR